MANRICRSTLWIYGGNENGSVVTFFSARRVAPCSRRAFGSVGRRYRAQSLLPPRLPGHGRSHIHYVDLALRACRAPVTVRRAPPGVVYMRPHRVRPRPRATAVRRLARSSRPRRLRARNTRASHAPTPPAGFASVVRAPRTSPPPFASRSPVSAVSTDTAISRLHCTNGTVYLSPPKGESARARRSSLSPSSKRHGLDGSSTHQ